MVFHIVNVLGTDMSEFQEWSALKVTAADIPEDDASCFILGCFCCPTPYCLFAYFRDCFCNIPSSRPLQTLHTHHFIKSGDFYYAPVDPDCRNEPTLSVTVGPMSVSMANMFSTEPEAAKPKPDPPAAKVLVWAPLSPAKLSLPEPEVSKPKPDPPAAAAKVSAPPETAKPKSDPPAAKVSAAPAAAKATPDPPAAAATALLSEPLAPAATLMVQLAPDTTLTQSTPEPKREAATAKAHPPAAIAVVPLAQEATVVGLQDGDATAPAADTDGVQKVGKGREVQKEVDDASSDADSPYSRAPPAWAAARTRLRKTGL